MLDTAAAAATWNKNLGSFKLKLQQVREVSLHFFGIHCMTHLLPSLTLGSIRKSLGGGLQGQVRNKDATKQCQ